ncbi:MAG: sulfatase-like hydrolase/transferase [Oscillospiraceae bacterium]|nr:sulfatase-like hydrolase/transferase [Oscillospiraceae bacterium]
MKKTGDIFSAILQMLFLPFCLVYFEALLRAFGGEGFGGYGYALLFGISAGLFLSAALSLLPPKANRVCTTITAAVIGLAYTAEALVKKNFQSYMSPASLFSGAKGVLTNYADNLAAAIIGGIPQILLFLAPAIVYGIFSSKLVTKKSKLICPAVSAVLSVGMFFGGTLILDNSSDFGDDFSMRTESFGLLTAVRLNISGTPGAENDTGFVFAAGDNLTLGKSETADKPDAVPAVSPNVNLPVTLGKSGELGMPDKPDIPLTLGATGAATTPTLGTSHNNEPPHEEAPTETGQTTPEKNEPQTDKPTPIPPKAPNEEELAALAEIGDNVMAIDFDGAYARNPNSTVADLNKYVQSLTPSNKNMYTGLFKGKNLILICAEAFSDAAIDKELTPTLYRMTHNGIYFSDYYQPTWGGSTTTGEFSFVTGLVPESGLESMQKIADNNNYFTLGNGLQRLGYASCAFHNGNYDYYSRNLTHKNLGYDDFLAFGSGLENITRKYSEDSAMIDKTVDLYLDKQPFSLYYMTVSGHFSYKADNVKVKENLARVREVFGNKYKDKTNYYFCYQMEVDKAMEMLIKKLEEAGIADNTIICITADHYPYGLEQSTTYGNSEDYLSDLYGYKHSAPWEKDRNAWILWSGCLENDRKEFACEISEPTYSLDIVPTLYNLFGLEFDSRLMVGRDVFSDAPPLVVWNNLSWATDKGRYDSKTKQFTAADGYAYSKEYVTEINNIVKNKIYFSKQTVNYDYYRALFGEDEYK